MQRRPDAPGLARLARLTLLVLLAVLVFSAVQPDSGAGDASGGLMPWAPSSITYWEPDIRASAEAHGLSPALIAIVMLIESGGNPRAYSGAGAVGLMQVMPATAAELAAQRGLSYFDLWDPTTNLDLGSTYLARQLASFGSPGLSAAAYNGGPGSVLDWQAGGRLPAESARARYYVGGMWRERHLERSPIYEEWLARYGAGLVAEARSLQGQLR